MSDSNVPVVYLTPAQFVAQIMENKGTTIISFEAATEPKLKKTGNPLALPVMKISHVNGIIGYDYENSVNNQREREGSERDFVAEPRAWGTRISRSLVEHKGEYYLTVKVERVLDKPRYFDAHGVELSSEDVSPYLPAAGATRQDVEKEVIPRDYKITNIRNMRIGGKRVEIVNK